jgi:hypothetical protein
MRTTVRLDDNLLEQVKKEAARQGRTLTSLIDEALRQALAQSRQRTPKKRVRLPVSRESGGTLPGVDLNDSASLLDVMEGRS